MKSLECYLHCSQNMQFLDFNLIVKPSDRDSPFLHSKNGGSTWMCCGRREIFTSNGGIEGLIEGGVFDMGCLKEFKSSSWFGWYVHSFLYKNNFIRTLA